MMKMITTIKIFLRKLIRILLKGISNNILMREDIDVYNHLKAIGLNFDLIIDVGVGKGTEDLYKSFSSKASFFMVEPLSDFNEEIHAIASRIKLSYEIFNFAASNTKGKSSINVHENPSGSSLLLEKFQSNEYNGFKREIDLNRIDSITRISNFRDIFLKIDVQGPNLDVLEGCENIFDKIQAIQIESYIFDTFDSNKDQSIKAIINYLDSKGFRIFDFSSFLKRPLDNSIIQLELFFLKSDSRVFSNPKFK